MRKPDRGGVSRVTESIAVAGSERNRIAASGCGGDSDSGGEFTAAFKKTSSTAPWIHHVTGVKMLPTTPT